MTGGRGPDACIDAVGLEAHGATLDAYLDKAKTAAFLATDRPNALRQAIHCCRKGGIVSIPGVYGGFLDKIPFGAAFQKGLTFKMGQTHMMKYMKPLLDRIERGEIDPSFVITHRFAARRGGEGVPDVPRPQGRVHQGRAEAARRDGALRKGKAEGKGRPPDLRVRLLAINCVSAAVRCFAAAARSVSRVSFDGAQSERLCQPLCASSPPPSIADGSSRLATLIPSATLRARRHSR